MEEEDGFSAILSSHDMNTVDFVDQIVDAGVSSLKIEGRMKTPYYIATVTRAYRMRLDGADPALCARELDYVSHRPYSSGFYFNDEKYTPYNDGLYHQEKRVAAVVLGWEKGILTVEQRNLFSQGDALELLAPGLPGEGFVVEAMTTLDGESVTRAPHPRQILKIPCAIPAAPGDMLRMDYVQ